MKIKNDRTRTEILEYTKKKLREEGYTSINIRDIAKNVGISSGTVYNYFANKDEILLVLTEEYWRNALKQLQNKSSDGPFYQQIELIYAFLFSEIQDSAGLLMGSLSNVAVIGKGMMKEMQSTLNSILKIYIDEDKEIIESIWDDEFTKDKYVAFIVQNMLLALRMKQKDINFFLEIMKRTLY